MIELKKLDKYVRHSSEKFYYLIRVESNSWQKAMNMSSCYFCSHHHNNDFFSCFCSGWTGEQH